MRLEIDKAYQLAGDKEKKQLQSLRELNRL